MKEQDHICNANPVDVCLRAACMCSRYNVLLCILHTCSIKTRALWILISHFVISRYPGGEVCALECEASVCLDVTSGSAGDLHFSISEDNSGTWLRRMWLTELGLDCRSEDLCKKRLLCFAGFFFCPKQNIWKRSLTFSGNGNQSYTHRSEFWKKAEIFKYNRCQYNNHYSFIVCSHAEN